MEVFDLPGRVIGLESFEELLAPPHRFTDLRYFRSAERDEANDLGTALGRMGAAPARVSFVPGHEANAARRHYELWFAPPRG